LTTQTYRFMRSPGVIAIDQAADPGTVYHHLASVDQLERGEVSLERSSMQFCSVVDGPCP
jgi:hypothetical protein